MLILSGYYPPPYPAAHGYPHAMPPYPAGTLQQYYVDYMFQIWKS